MSLDDNDKVTLTFTAKELRLLTIAAIGAPKSKFSSPADRLECERLALLLADITGGERKPIDERGDWTTDAERKDLPEEGGEMRADPRSHYIEHTRGIWVRKNRAKDELEIWYNGVFQAAWKDADKISERLTTLIRTGFDIGKRAGTEEARAALRKAFGI